MILDIHTHKAAPQPGAVVNFGIMAGIDSGISSFAPLPGQVYSVGIHPWATRQESFPRIHMPLAGTALAGAARRPEVAAVGECGYDALKGGPAFLQLQVFKSQVELAERVGKPMIIHDVRGHEMILGCCRSMKAAMPWAVHGFRGKPSVAQMLLRAGLWLSFGECYNPESLRFVLDKYPERLLAETDESALSISEIIAAQSRDAGCSPSVLTDLIEANTEQFLGKGFPENMIKT